MKNEVFKLHGQWFVAFNGRTTASGWPERGPAEACLQLLTEGHGVLLEDGVVKWIHNG